MATQLEAAASSGAARATSGATSSPRVVKTRTGARVTARTASSTKLTPSRLVRKTSDSSAVIVTATRSGGGSSAASARRTSGSACLSRQISKGRLAVRTLRSPPPASTTAAFTYAPPMSQPSARCARVIAPRRFPR